jgi:hypothetical protein
LPRGGRCWESDTRMKTIAILMLMAAAAVAGDVPADLERLRTSWNEARQRALEPIDRKYLAALESLKARLTREGKLEDAVMVGAEAETVANHLADADMGKRKVVSRWAWGSGGTLTLTGDGRARHTAWTKEGSWMKLASGGMVIESDSGQAFVVAFGADGIGRVKSIDGKSTTTIAAK